MVNEIRDYCPESVESFRSGKNKLTFLTVSCLVSGYLDNPEITPPPFEEVASYFRFDSQTWEYRVGELESLLGSLSEINNLGFDNSPPKHSTPGTIAMGLPYFYPIQMNLLSSLVQGEIKRVKEAPEAQKQEMQKSLLDRSTQYDPYAYSLADNTTLIHDSFNAGTPPRQAAGGGIFQRLRLRL